MRQNRQEHITPRCHDRHWNEEDRKKVAALLLNGLTSSKIAGVMGLSRNAVIGRVARDHYLHDQMLKGQCRPPAPPKAPNGTVSKPMAKFINLVPRQKTLPPHKKPPPSLPKVVRAPAVMRTVELRQLDRDQCRFAVKEDPDAVGRHLFCGNPTHQPGAPYCAFHWRLVGGDTPGRAQ